MAPSLFVDPDELDAVLDAINERPLCEAVKQKLSNAIRNRMPEDLAALVIDLHRDGRLCLPAPRDDGTPSPASSARWGCGNLEAGGAASLKGRHGLRLAGNEARPQA